MDANDIRKRYIDSKYSINNNLPMPTIQTLSNHTYISIVDIIRHMLGHGMIFDKINPVENSFTNITSSISQSSRAIEIWPKSRLRFPNGNVIPIWIIEWSDDFDPNDSIKSSRGSACVKTVTIGTPSGIKNNKHMYTYPIAIGEKGISHEEVEEKFLWDMELLSGNNNLLFIVEVQRK